MLPTNHIINLVRELNKRLQGHAQSGLSIIKWLKCVLMIHTSYLMSYPDLIDSLGSVYEIHEIHAQNYFHNCLNYKVNCN
jgi:U3 small nucleolar RNA-associated protein 5